MISRRGVISGPFLVLITLIFCGVSIGVYLNEQANSANSLVSPREVLKVQDDLEIYRIKEKAYILESLEVAKGKGEFGVILFYESFRSEFLEKVAGDSFMTEFIFKDLYVSGKSLSSEARLFSGQFFSETLYPTGDKGDGSKMEFVRSKIGKNFRLVADDKYKINFPVEFTFYFEEKYIITKVGDKFIIK